MPCTSATIRRDHVALGAGRDAGDVRQPGERREGPATEVEDVELRLLRRRRQRHARDDRAQQGALAAARAADDRDVAGRAGQVDAQGVAALLARPVDRPERHGERAEPPPLLRHQPEPRVHGQVGHQLVEGVGHVERRQPHLVGGRALADHVPDGDVEQRVLLAGLRGLRLGLGLGHLDVELEHLGDREGEDALQLAALVAAYAHAAGRRTGDVRRLEPHQRGRVRLQVAEAGHRRELVGVGDAEHRAGLLGAEGPQADPVGEVRLEAAQAALLEPLGGEQQVQAERAAEPADGHEQVDELGLGGQHLGELVDHDEQRRQRDQVLAAGAGLLVVADRGEVAGLAEQLLAAHHLAGQRVLHAVDERELLGEVGDHRRDVRQAGHAGERRAALEVDEHQVELLG